MLEYENITIDVAISLHHRDGFDVVCDADSQKIKPRINHEDGDE